MSLCTTCHHVFIVSKQAHFYVCVLFYNNYIVAMILQYSPASLCTNVIKNSQSLC